MNDLQKKSILTFCPQCGGDQFTYKGDKVWSCLQCSFIYFHNTAAAVAAMIWHGDKLLLTMRKNSPAKGKLDLPGGFVDYQETLEEALTREVKEELALNVGVDRWNYEFSLSNHYPYKGVIYHTADAFFSVKLESKPDIVAADDVAGFIWLTTQEIDIGHVGLSSIQVALERLQATGKH